MSVQLQDKVQNLGGGENKKYLSVAQPLASGIEMQPHVVYGMQSTETVAVQPVGYSTIRIINKLNKHITQLLSPQCTQSRMHYI
jgi:hypothetical protein